MQDQGAGFGPGSPLRRGWILGIVWALLLGPASVAGAVVLSVAEGDSIQAAIAAALPGDVIDVGPGDFFEDLDFLGKAVTVRGQGPDTVVHGTGAGPVVSFVSGEGPLSVLHDLVVTGGLASAGGGIRIADASPSVLRTIVFYNRATGQGAGIYVARSDAVLMNNLVLYNFAAAGDPHAIWVTDAAPRLVNNTIVRNDSNGVFVPIGAAPELRNNLIAFNGLGDRGRGICDFSGGLTRIAYSLVTRNRVAALLTDGRDFPKITGAERRIGAPRLVGNLTGDADLLFDGAIPRLHTRGFDRTSLDELIAGLRPNPSGDGPAIDTGDPDFAYDDLDGTRNDVGFTGGPEAPAW